MDLGFDKPPGRVRPVVAMSGGVDSSATAALLKQAGYDVAGVTMRLLPPNLEAGARACCGGAEAEDARRVAEHLGIPHHVVDCRGAFYEDVIRPFADTYARGETPIPCVDCNRTVKFRDLLGLLDTLDADALVTGHYARWHAGPGGPELHRGADSTRDQSYFLFATTRDQLARLRFPLGDLDKATTRARAAELALPVADKPASQDICFVPDGDYAALVARLRPDAATPGPMVHVDGRVLGEHRGLVHYTVGQRRGLNVGGPGPRLYVVRLDPASNTLVVGPWEALLTDRIGLHGLNWLGESPPDSAGERVTIKLRSAHTPVPATLYPAAAPGRATVSPDDPQPAVAPGQACVAYRETRVLGGGWIHKSETANR